MTRYILFPVLLCNLLTSLNLYAEVGDVTLVEKLKKGGYVILVRHAIASNSQQDTDFKNLTYCKTQRNLTEAGRKQAAAIGKAYRALELPTGTIYSSFFCRCVDTANLAFGKPETLLELSSFMRETDEEQKRRVKEMNRLLKTPPAPNTNNILVAHSIMSFRASSTQLYQGQAAVFLPLPDGRFQFVDFIAPKRWQRMLDAVMEEEDL